jgi:hypothetical protein
MTSNYLNYERTHDKAAAARLNDFDSKLVLKKLATLVQKNASRVEVVASCRASELAPIPSIKPGYGHQPLVSLFNVLRCFCGQLA